jgi:hypothetical protein
LIVVRDTERLSDADECKALGDDVNFAKWNFLGSGLLVHEGTPQDLKNCISVPTLPGEGHICRGEAKMLRGLALFANDTCVRQ